LLAEQRILRGRGFGENGEERERAAEDDAEDAA
jgi:hypothetical protein